MNNPKIWHRPSKTHNTLKKMNLFDGALYFCTFPRKHCVHATVILQISVATWDGTMTAMLSARQADVHRLYTRRLYKICMFILHGILYDFFSLGLKDLPWLILSKQICKQTSRTILKSFHRLSTASAYRYLCVCVKVIGMRGINRWLDEWMSERMVIFSSPSL